MNTDEEDIRKLRRELIIARTWADRWRHLAQVQQELLKTLDRRNDALELRNQELERDLLKHLAP